MSEIIQRFDEVDGLYACYHAGESDTEVNGTDVVSVSPAYSGLPLDVNALPGPEAAKVQFKGDTIGANGLLAWTGFETGYCNLTATISPVVDWSTTGFTLLRVDQYNGGGNSESGGIYTDAPGAFPDYRSSNGFYRVRWSAGSEDRETSVPYTVGDPQISVAVNDPDVATGSYTITVNGNSKVYGPEPNRAPRTDNKYLVFCGGMNPFQVPNAGFGFNGLTSMFVLYDRILDQTDIDKIVALAQYWLDNGEAPADTNLPTSTSFGPVLTEDLLATLKWQVSDAVDTNWYDVDDESNGLVPRGIAYGLEEEAPAGQSDLQPDNRLDITSAEYGQTVYLKCVATTGYAPDGLDSNVNTLTVIGDPLPEPVDPKDMILTVTVPAEDLVFTLPFQAGTYDCTIDWGDDTTPDAFDIVGGIPDASHDYTATGAGTYEITVSGIADAPYFNATGDAGQLVDIKQWGKTGWTNCRDAFNSCIELGAVAASESDLSAVADLTNMFRSCTSTTTLDLSGWDVSSVLSIDAMFRTCSALTAIDVSDWQTGSMVDLTAAFRSCSSLTTLDLSSWDISSVTDMTDMFRSASSLTAITFFTGSTGLVTSTINMFAGVPADPDISGWDISSLINATGMMSGSGFSSENYKPTIKAWQEQANRNDSVSAHFGSASLVGDSAAETARGLLVSENLWTIIDFDGTHSPAAVANANGEVTQVTPDAPIYWSAIGPSGDVIHTGNMAEGLTIRTGQANIIYSSDMNAYLADLNGSTAVAPPLPAAGTPLTANEVYAWNAQNVVVRQSHTRTNDDPDTVPALFSVWREDYDGLHWIANEDVLLGYIRKYDGTDYECIQAHTTQEGWTPPSTPSLWTEVVSGIQPWEQPEGSHDAYQMGDKVTHNGSTWESDVNDNVWEPGVFGWSVITTP